MLMGRARLHAQESSFRTATRPPLGRGAGPRPAPAEARTGAVLAAELGCALVSDAIADGRDIPRPGHQHQARALQTDLLLELNRAERGRRLEAAMKVRGAHPAFAGKFLDPEGLAVVLGDPAHRAADVIEAAVDCPNLADRLAERAGDHPPQDLAFDQRRERVSILGMVEQPK